MIDIESKIISYREDTNDYRLCLTREEITEINQALTKKEQIKAEVIDEVLTILKTHHMIRTYEDNFMPSIEVKTYTYLFEKFKELKEQNKWE